VALGGHDVVLVNRTLVRMAGSRGRLRARLFGGFLACGVIGLAWAPQAHADAFRGTGRASASEKSEKKPAATVDVRKRALVRARKAALEAALAGIATANKLDAGAKKAVLAATDAWTGSYRVLGERSEGDATVVDVEVEIDVGRLTKRVLPGAALGPRAQPMYALGEVATGSDCAQATGETIRTEWTAAAAIGGDGVPVEVAVRCVRLGPVRHTHLHAAKVEVAASAATGPITSAEVHAFANDADAAVAAALADALAETAPALARHRRGSVRLRVQAARPAARVRRLERALQESVVGVQRVEVGGVDAKGSVLLRLAVDLDVPTLARKLGELRQAGLTITVLAIEGPDALSVRLD
jgi:hypothetical protein